MKRGEARSAGISIRWKLAAFLAIFITIVLIVLWIFQVYLLDAFYEQIKEKEMRESAHSIAERLQNEQMDEEKLRFMARTHAIDYNMTVIICRLEKGTPQILANMDATGNYGGILSEEMLIDLCRTAHENGGTYYGRFFGATEVEGEEELPFLPEEDEPRVKSQHVRLMHLSVVQNKDSGESYFIVMSASLAPYASTVEILKTQFLWIAVILLICAGIMVFLLYRHISAPLVSMNAAARQLAHGNYDVHFSETGYRETRELAETLNYASNELSQLDRLQKELIANISHDLRTPLTMIKGYGEIMRDLPGENTPENMQVVIDETTRLSELVNDLLDLSALQSGSRKPNFEVFDLTAAIEETLHRYDTFVRHRGYHIQVETNTSACVKADRGMILQVLYNLINNAINYTGEDLTVRVAQTVVGGRIRISVTDTGEGIEPEQMPLIWDRYYKVDKVHRRAMIGTGLGLSIVKGILETHEAAYGIDSTIGKGSTFWFELPIEPTPNTLISTDGEE